MRVKRDSVVEESGGRRTRKNMLSRRIGMISTILHDQITMRSTSTARKRFEKSQSGKIGSTHTARFRKLLVTSIAMKTSTGHK
jgi:hypothetical protein